MKRRSFLKHSLVCSGILTTLPSNSPGVSLSRMQIYNGISNLKVDPYWRSIGLQMSGGTNSSLLAYILAKSIVDKNLNTKIRRISFEFADSSKNLQINREIELEITRLVGRNVWLEPYEKVKPNRAGHSIRDELSYLFSNSMIDHTMNARCKNASLTHVPDPNSERMLDRDRPVHNENYEITEPFYNLTKDLILGEYNRLGLQSLLEKTISCESQNGHEQSCGHCYWCRHRDWATQFSKKLA